MFSLNQIFDSLWLMHSSCSCSVQPCWILKEKSNNKDPNYKQIVKRILKRWLKRVLKYIFFIPSTTTFQKIYEKWLKSEVNNFTKILRRWKKIPRRMEHLNDGRLLLHASKRLSKCFLQAKIYQKEFHWEKQMCLVLTYACILVKKK